MNQCPSAEQSVPRNAFQSRLSVIWGLIPVLRYSHPFACSQGLEVESGFLNRCFSAATLMGSLLPGARVRRPWAPSPLAGTE